ncbi:MAG: uroporphyrinogen decarboxylase family protein [bacterium]|nr:uroporphyrinogen decarboxylase family protein [bacterium]
MKTLSSKERLSRLFEKKDIDRVPIWLLFPYHPIGCYVDVYKISCYRPVLDAVERYGVDILDRRNFYTGFCFSVSPEIKRAKEIIEGENEIIVKERIFYRDISLEQERVIKGGRSKITEPFVKDIEDLDKILRFPYEPPRPDVNVFFKEKEELGDRGLMMVDIGDPLGVLFHLCSIEDFCIWSLEERERLINFLDVIYERVLDMYRYLLENNVGPVYFIVGAEFAGPPIVSPTYFSELCARYVKGIVDLIRSYGMWSIVHYHGNLKKVLEGIKYINPDGLHTVEAPPVGDCTLLEARKALGDMILIGNIQYDDLASLDESEVRELTKEILKEGMTGRFILSPTAGPYQESISEKMQKNYIAFIETGIDYGRF